MGDRDNLPELAEDWIWSTLGEVFDVYVGATPSRQRLEYWKGNIPWVSSGEVAFCKIRKTRETITELGLQNTSTTVHPPGTVLLGMIGEGKTRGQVAILEIAASNNQNSAAIRVSEAGLPPEYIYYFLEGEYERTRRLGSGNNQPALNKSRVQLMPFPLPPLAEQHRIVAKIEELFSELDAGVELLKKLKAKLKRYRQAVLKAAVEGKLTKDWREAHQGELEPASVLLERILKERREKWEAEQLAQMKAKGKTPKDDSWKLKYKEPVAPDTFDLPELPEGWVWVNLGQFTGSVKDGPHYSPKYVDEGIPFIMGGNVRPSGVDFANAKRINPELQAELSKRCKPEKGNILYTKGGTTGIARVNTYDIDFNVWVHVAVLKLASSIEPFYVQHALNSPFCYAQSQRFTHGVGNQDLGLTRMVNIILPLPSLDEQKQIISEVERQSSVIDELEKVVNQNLKRAEKLRQSILKKAFEGKLVPQDPTDEPADKLLERIKAEKAKREAEAKAKKKQKQPGKSQQLELF